MVAPTPSIAARGQRIPGKMTDRAIQGGRGGTERLACGLDHFAGTLYQVTSSIHGAVRDIPHRGSYIAGYTTTTASSIVAAVGATAGIATSLGHFVFYSEQRKRYRRVGVGIRPRPLFCEAEKGL
jgi:hypothetical protein